MIDDRELRLHALRAAKELHQSDMAVNDADLSTDDVLAQARSFLTFLTGDE